MIAPIDRPLSNSFADPSMYWVVYKEIYCERLEVRYPGSEHPAQVRRVLDRFTRYQSLTARRLCDVVNLDVEAYVAKRRQDRWRGKPLCNRTLNNEIHILNAVFTFAGPRTTGHGRKYLGLIAAPPFVEALPEDALDPVVLTASQLERYLDATQHATTPALPGMTPPQFWLAVLVLTSITALRRKALLGIPRPDDYRLYELRELILPAHLSKVRREQRITLGRRDEVINILGSLPSKAGEPLLPWKDASGQPMTLGHFNNTMAAFQRAAGIADHERVKTKHLRSTAATEVGDLYGDAVAKKRLGHAPGSRTFDIHYKGRRPTDVDRDASDHLAELLLKTIQGPRPRPSLAIFLGDAV